MGADEFVGVGADFPNHVGAVGPEAADDANDGEDGTTPQSSSHPTVAASTRHATYMWTTSPQAPHPHSLLSLAGKGQIAPWREVQSGTSSWPELPPWRPWRASVTHASQRAASAEGTTRRQAVLGVVELGGTSLGVGLHCCCCWRETSDLKRGEPRNGTS